MFSIDTLGPCRGYVRENLNGKWGEWPSKNADRQKDDIQLIAKDLKLEIPDEAVFVEVDGASGSDFWDEVDGKSGRPGLKALFDDISAGKVKYLFVKTRMALWTDHRVCKAIVEELARNGVQLYHWDGLLDVSTPQARSELIAEAANDKSNRMMRG